MNPVQQAADPIRHVVLLLFENHSFDQMLGCFKQLYPDLAGVDPARPGVNGHDGRQYAQRETTERQMMLDPHHEVNHVAVQMADGNSGFVKDLVDSNPHASAGELDQQCEYVMGYYPLDFLPALHRLARDFLICDHWFSSLPGPTWPNRFFALTGTSSGKVNMPEDGEHSADLEGWFQQDQPTIFDRLSEQSISWNVYYHDIPQSVCLVHQRLPENTARYAPFTQFLQDAASPESAFPAFSFIEPDYNGATENDDHPPHDVMNAQKLLADVYNAIRANGDLWNATLLVVVYDEHGGFYDHALPPAAVPPSPPQPDWEEQQFGWFRKLGVRVPALLVSPWVNQGFDATVFDHTSLLKYLVEKWELGQLGDRVAHANSIGPLIQHQARTQTVAQVKLPPEQLTPPNPDLEARAGAYITSHHKALARIGRRLQWEMMTEFALTAAWVTYPLETLLHLLFGLGNRIVFHFARWRTRVSWQRFHTRRKRQAIAKLAPVIRHPTLADAKKRFAAETLGMAVGEPFHLQEKPAEAARAWLDRNLPV